MNWLKRIFCSQEEFNVHANGLPKVSIEIPMPKVKPCKAEKDISEPVISFVECVFNNPKRFKVLYDFVYYKMILIDGAWKRDIIPEQYNYRLQDLKTKESWTLSKGMSLVWVGTEDSHTYNPDYLTEDEKQYLIDSITYIMKDRESRRDRLQELRKERRIRDERNRLKGIYCA